jgi:hypothetical protein
MKEILRGTSEICEYKHENGEISHVRIEIAGMGIKRLRIAGLQPELKESIIKDSLAEYGEVMQIWEEMWAKSYRYKVYNGIRIVEIKLKKHIPSNLTISGNNAIVTYEGQPPTCYRCSETGHMQIDCPRRRQPYPTTNRSQHGLK